MLAQYGAWSGQALDFIIMLHCILVNTSRETRTTFTTSTGKLSTNTFRLQDHWRKYNACHVAVHTIYRRSKIVALRRYYRTNK